jgi:hypothetical protein
MSAILEILNKGCGEDGTICALFQSRWCGKFPLAESDSEFAAVNLPLIGRVEYRRTYAGLSMGR